MGNVHTTQKPKTCPMYYSGDKAKNSIAMTSHRTPCLIKILPEVNNKWKHAFRFYQDTIDISRTSTGKQASRQEIQDMIGDVFKGLNIHKWKALNNLELFPYRVEIFDVRKTEEAVRPQMSKVSSLKRLTFKRWCKNLNDSNLQSLGCRISRNLLRLQSLSIGFEYCQQLTDQGIIAFIKELTKGLYDLKELSVTFSHFLQLTDHGFITFISHICRKLVNLKSLTLVFVLCIEITNQSTEALIIEIKRHLTKLTKLELRFLSPCKQLKIYCKDIQYLQEKLSYIPRLVLHIN